MAPPIDPTRYGCLPAATSVKIRLERHEDAPAIHTLTEAAFENVRYSAHTEARFVDALRSSGALTLSLVALDQGDIVGHAAFSPVRIDQSDRGLVWCSARCPCGRMIGNACALGRGPA